MHRGPLVALAGSAALYQGSASFKYFGGNLARIGAREAFRGWLEQGSPKHDEGENAFEKGCYCPTVADKESEVDHPEPAPSRRGRRSTEFGATDEA